MIDKKVILHDYAKLKQLALKFSNKKDYSNAVYYMQRASVLMYNSNLFYSDEDLENLLQFISKQAITSNAVKQNHKKRMVFYDYFVIDNRGLTEQYLDALFSFDYEILYIGCRNDEKSQRIYSKLLEHNVVCKFVTNLDGIEKAQFVFQIFSEFCPQIIVAHTSPWDVPGLMAINRFDENCKRFLINITDHAFWLGTTVFDFFLEFRDYGYNISKVYRKIDERKLLKMPYYPLINKNNKFDGFDFDTEGKKLIFSGGSIYKIQGSHIFFDIVKYIISNYSDTLFLFIGNGDSQYVHDFINNNKYQNRVFYQSERKDIYEVFRHCYFYLNTYPLIGGLMTQYACVAGKLPLTYNDNCDPCNNVSELMIDCKDIKVEFDDFDSLKDKLDYYLNNPDVLASDSEKIKNAVIQPEVFNRILYDYLQSDTPVSKLGFNAYEIDIAKFAEQYIERFNEKSGLLYYRLIIDTRLRNLWYFPICILKGIRLMLPICKYIIHNKLIKR